MENVSRFSDRAEAYERFRTRFPRTIIERLQVLCGLVPEHVIADVGAGTGMLSELFLEQGNRVFAVEPNEAMRQGCVRLAKRLPNLTVIAAPAEETTLAASSIDFIVVGRAFHWFDRPRALREFSRILRPNGWVVLLSSKWSGTGSPAALEFEDILKTKSLDYSRVLEAQLDEENVRTMFVRGTCTVEDIHGEQFLTLEELRGRMQSLSVTPTPGHRLYGTFNAAVEAYFSKHRVEELIRMDVSYQLVCGRLPAK
jgi:ubiquinone/menaquinone biosynthesis C-methylase UbiE